MTKRGVNLAMLGKPSIAVLAFTNMSGDVIRSIFRTASPRTSSRSYRAAIRCL